MTASEQQNLLPQSSWLTSRLRCPDCHARDLKTHNTTVRCGTCSAAFPVLGGKPVLIRSDNPLFPPRSYLGSLSRAEKRKSSSRPRLSPARSVNLAYRRNLQAFAANLDKSQSTSVLVIGAGSQKDWLEGLLAKEPSVRIVYCDVDVRGKVDLFCDAHDVPFVDETFDGVVASAVLEHVTSPERVVGEIHRVLRAQGLLYSEIPFLQQVHEGAYDFTRYTLSGHRRLLNRFEELSSGVVAGPATTLAWAIEHFALCLVPHSFLVTPIRAVVRTAFAWLKYLDFLLVRSPGAADGASCTYFLGRKSASTRPDIDIVAKYTGLQSLRHV